MPRLTKPGWRPKALAGCGLSLILIQGGPALAAQRVSQNRINEWAASLLRAHRALIDEPGLRRNGERLDLYLQRIAAPLDGETDEKWRARMRTFAAALTQAAGTGRLCLAAPALRDASPENAAAWRRAVRASAALPGSCARALAAIQSAGDTPSVARRRLVGLELTRTMYVVKDAFEALREARP